MDGDAAAFREFVAARSPDLMRVAFLLTGDYGEAEDVVQSTLEKVYLSWDRIRSREVPQVLDAYSRRTLTRLVLTRRRQRRVRHVLTASVPDVAAPDQEPAGVDNALLRALLELPPRQRAVLVLRFAEDRSEVDVAALLGISVGAVKQHTHRGLSRLRSVLTVASEVPND